MKKMYDLWMMLMLCTVPLKALEGTKSSQKVFESNPSAIKINLSLQKNITRLKLAMISIIIVVIGYHANLNITHFIREKPISAFAISFLGCNYIIDTLAQYQKISCSCKKLIMSDSLIKCLLSLWAVAHHQKLIQHTQNPILFEQDFDQTVQEQTGQTIHELEKVATNIAQQYLAEVSILTHEKNISQDFDHGHIYFALKNKLSIYQLEEIVKQDRQLSIIVTTYLKNPSENYQKTILEICNLINKQMCYLMKKNLNFGS